MSELKEQIGLRALDLLNTLTEAVKQGTNLAMEQLPLLAQEYIIYGRVSLTAYVILGVLMLVYVARNINNISILEEVKSFIISLIPISLLGIGLIIINLNSAILVWIAPKIWLIKELANMFK